MSLKLKQIKLAGFKSFVDPTVLDLRSDLVCVVGPNGCGKSNVIDAVKWVMGESSAKTLRGESITDVIFNGSNTRKPIGQASIELNFDNSDGSIGGEYAAYAEITVRREVNRDAVSNYYLNGTRCRRRDIVDVFLGTGLGSRSYSIIEQGMISRIIESKPEELRSFIEEAAGISVYKKRRHDTELRMRHTTENLQRLEDLREEQLKLLERLKRQSESAQKFRVFNTEKELLDSQLLALRWQEYDTKMSAYAQQILDLSVQLEEKLATRASIGAALERVRIEHEENSDEYNAVQSKFYDLGAMVARLEQNLQHQKERKIQLETDVEQVKNTIVEITSQKTSDSETLIECQEQIFELTPEFEQATMAAEQAEELYQDLRLSLDNINQEWDDFQQQVQVPQQQAEVQKMRIEQLDKQTRDLQVRIDRLLQEAASLDIAGVAQNVQELSAELATVESRSNSYKLEITDVQAKINSQRTSLQQQQDRQNQIRSDIQQSKGRESALLALQQAALGKDDKLMRDWLAANNLESMPRLAQTLEVEPGWELAVETVLADYLEAICVEDQWDAVVAKINDLSDGKLSIFAAANSTNTGANITNNTLLSKIKTTVPLEGLLADYLVAEDLAAALQLRNNISAQQSIITKDGIWLGKHWLRISRVKDQRRGILQREQDLNALKLHIEQQSAIAQELDDSIAAAVENLHDLESELAAKQQAANQEAIVLRDLTAKYSVAQQKLDNMQNRKQRISLEIEDHQQQLAVNSVDSSAARTEVETAIETMAAMAIRKDEIIATREQLQARERSTKMQVKELQDQHHDLELKLQNLTTRSQGLQHTISRVDQQLSALHSRHQQLLQNLQDDIEPTKQLQEELDDLLAKRSSVEAEMQQAKRVLEVYTEQMKQHEDQRIELENAAAGIKDILDKCRLEKQSLEVRKETIDEQLQELALDIQQIVAGLPEEANEHDWSERVEALTRKISNLGAINMAAIEEFDAETQRNQYLEAQYNDLKEALTTLDNAIKKIDRETRSKFKETFDTINNNFQVLFPKLFGGGKAYLEIVGEDYLEAGVTVMAMPPGKKNATIHLLSGGEKALTAVSLVFSIFQLNPAPFCMLDEVDAPLDESNVVRFGGLIKEMSSSVQFIVITHNKTTMEIANQLIGVTMKEPGVSRLVSVDINEAVEMVTA